jgi:hypothetical protein
VFNIPKNRQPKGLAGRTWNCFTEAVMASYRRGRHSGIKLAGGSPLKAVKQAPCRGCQPGSKAELVERTPERGDALATGQPAFTSYSLFI